MKDNKFNKKLLAAFHLNIILVHVYNYHIYLYSFYFWEITSKEYKTKILTLVRQNHIVSHNADEKIRKWDLNRKTSVGIVKQTPCGWIYYQNIKKEQNYLSEWCKNYNSEL